MFEIVTLFVGYFFYEADANNWWWTAYWIIVGLRVVKELSAVRTYWEIKKDHNNLKGF